MSGTLHPVLQAVRTPDGRRRFYPPGEHPVTARLRRDIAALEALPESTQRDEALEWARYQNTIFEEGESIAKHEYMSRATAR